MVAFGSIVRLDVVGYGSDAVSNLQHGVSGDDVSSTWIGLSIDGMVGGGVSNAVVSSC